MPSDRLVRPATALSIPTQAAAHPEVRAAIAAAIYAASVSALFGESAL